MNQQALEAAAKVLAKAHGCDLDNIEERSRSSFIDTARAALTAYAEATGERVATANSTGEDVKFMLTTSHLAIPIVSGADLKNGEVIVIRKVGT